MAKNFTFKQFHIDAYKCGMPVSTDAVLLGAWSNIIDADSILDIGCGTGILALMSAQRNPVATICAIEIEDNAFNAAVNNKQNSPWSERINIQHISVCDYVKTNQKFEAIVCNPPYFNDGEASKNAQRATARHTSTLTHVDLLHYCNRLLVHSGHASFVLPKVEGVAFIALIEELKLPLALSRLTYVKTTSDKESKRVLIELTKDIQPSFIETIVDELVIHEGNGYSEAFIELTKAFYLKM